MKKQILKLFLFFGVLFGFTFSTVAQSVTKYKDRDVRPNSIVVKYDNKEIKAKGLTTTPQLMAASVMNDFEAIVTESLNKFNVEEWEVTGDISDVLNRLNRIPGVKAFPNYVYSREDLKPTLLSDDEINRHLKKELHGTNRTKPSTEIKYTLGLGSLNSFSPINRIYDENFDDTASVNSEWTVIDYSESGTKWELVPSEDSGFHFEVKNNTDTVVSVSTDLYAPSFDLSSLDSSKSYQLRFNLENSFSLNTFIGFGYESNQNGSFLYDISNFGGYLFWDISRFVGDTLTLDIYVENSEVQPGQFIFSIDDFYIEEFPTNDSFIELQYGLYNDGFFRSDAVAGADVSAFDAWQTSTGSDDVVVVVYDDGVDFNHDDLRDNAWVNLGEDINDDGVITEDDINGIDDDGNGYPDDFWGWSAVYNDNSFLNPGSFHGTHVAGILGAQGNNGIGVSGVAQDVSIISVMIFDEFGFTDAISIMRGYDYISSLLEINEVEITAVNQSWGGGGSLFYESDEQFVSVMTDYALHHASFEALWVVSAGNSASDRDELNFYSYPNNIQSPNIITVASTDWADRISGFSDFGIRTVDVGAPGSTIVSTFPNNGYAYLSGTSMAAPHVSGALALAKAANPDEGGFALAARVLAGSDIQSQFVGVFGEGGRLNSNGSVDPSSEGVASGLVASHGTAFFHRTFIDDAAQKSIGFINNTESDVTVTGINFSGEGAFAFDAQVSETVVPAGGAFGVPVSFDNVGTIGEILATASIQTSVGNVSVDLNGREQTFGYIELSPDIVDLGGTPYGTELSTSFDIINSGDKELEFGIFQRLFFFDLEFSNLLNSVNKVSVTERLASPKNRVDLNETMDMITAQVMLERGDQERTKIKYSPSGQLQNHDEEVIFFDDLNDADSTLAQWDLVSFGDGDAEGLNWELFDIGEEEVDNIFLAGDFVDGYENNFLPVAIPPSFDFSELLDQENKQMPAYLKFDYAAQLEAGYDFFYINVISNGSRLTTLDITDLGSLINDGNVYTAFLDISQFAGYDDIEFWFIVNTDHIITDGFGAFFDNVEVVVRDLPFFTSEFEGSVSAGGSQTIDVTIRTELLPPGDFVLATQVFSDAINAFYFGSPIHETYFESRFANVSIDPEYQDLGEVNKEEPTSFDFTATNTGALDVEYFADVFLNYIGFNSDNFSQVLSSAKEDAEQRFEGVSKEPTAFKPAEHKKFVESAMKSKSLSPFNGKDEMPNIRSKFSAPSLEADGDIFAEDFEGGELPEGWLVRDFSFGLGNVWDVENVGTEDDPFNALFAGNVENFVVFDNTITAAYTPLFDLSELSPGQNAVLEFDYSFFLEPGFDVASVWVASLEDEGIFANYLGSTEDVLFNDGGLYRTRADLSYLNGSENVYLIFILETDESVQSAYALVDNVTIKAETAIAYIDPSIGSIDSSETQDFEVTVNTPQLFPGIYRAISVVDYFSEESFTGRAGFQVTDFSIPNQPPVAVNDTIAVLAGDVIPLNALLGFILSNDTDEFGQIFLEDFTDPLYGDLKYAGRDVGFVYVAPLNYDGLDVMGYSITDGMSSDSAAVLISVRANPEFVKGSDQQYVFLEDNALTLSTVGMAAGVGGQDSELRVWASSHSSDVTITSDAIGHTMNLSATEDYFGQTSATFYVGHEGDPVDSMEVSIVVVPVNDPPVAAFTSEGTSSEFQFMDSSSDPKDVNDGGIVSWSWEFGDGSSSDDQNPSHNYTEIGTYTVTLKVTDNGGLTAESQEVIEVKTIVSTEDDIELPSAVELDQNYPNPFNPSTSIRFGLPEAGVVQLEVFNALGQKVAELVNGRKTAGWHTISFDASQLASGIYIYRITSGNFVKTNRMLLIK
ncbi:MAG: S8 family serine peptidase [Balneola sp.]|nr:S8 family serine peptidase [Balneola sp.]MBO6651620.1 S8 family serine peptidase [Balneola sp.]MBO6710714.1 S8 family serine peptidase [Balneola sp.]MBO6799400.1 S8 family serine peptidase [Balneola sp.]MBO6869471.1 S8 family serine peptidase [Balneola sp.]